MNDVPGNGLERTAEEIDAEAEKAKAEEQGLIYDVNEVEPEKIEDPSIAVSFPFQGGTYKIEEPIGDLYLTKQDILENIELMEQIESAVQVYFSRLEKPYNAYSLTLEDIPEDKETDREEGFRIAWKGRYV